MPTSLPTLFLSHGAPTLATDDSPTRRFLTALGPGLPRPDAIIVISAHWETDAPTVSTATAPETIHDFGGFPQALYDLRYPAPGAPEVARQAATLLRKAGFTAEEDATRGLDHGAWVPLLLMYPEADIPTLQLSVQTARGPAHAWTIGAALQPLRAEGVLIVGSGAATHNLREIFRRRPDAPAEPWATEFADWMADKVETGARDALLNYRAQAPHAAANHPTEEHLLPLFTAMAAGGGSGTRLHRDVENGAMAMDCYRFD